MTVHVTIELDEDVKARLDALAATRGVGAEEMAASAVRHMMEGEAQYRALIEAGRASAREGYLMPHEDVVRHAEARRRAFAAKSA